MKPCWICGSPGPCQHREEALVRLYGEKPKRAKRKPPTTDGWRERRAEYEARKLEAMGTQ